MARQRGKGSAKGSGRKDSVTQEGPQSQPDPAQPSAEQAVEDIVIDQDETQNTHETQPQASASETTHSQATASDSTQSLVPTDENTQSLVHTNGNTQPPIVANTPTPLVVEDTHLPILDPTEVFNVKIAGRHPKKLEIKLRRDFPERAPRYSETQVYCPGCNTVQPPLPVDIAARQAAEQLGISMDNTFATGIQVRGGFQGQCPQITLHVNGYDDPVTGDLVRCNHGLNTQRLKRTHERTGSPDSQESKKTPKRKRSRSKRPSQAKELTSNQGAEDPMEELEYTPRRAEGARLVLENEVEMKDSADSNDPSNEPGNAQHVVPQQFDTEACKVALKELIPMTAKSQAGVDGDELATTQLLLEQLKNVCYATVFKYLIDEVVEEQKEHPFHGLLETMVQQLGTPDEIVDYFVSTWKDMVEAAERLDDYNLLISEFEAAKLYEEEQKADTDNVAESNTIDSKVAKARQPVMYLPMTLKANRLAALNPTFWDEQEKVLDNMIVQYDGNVTHTPRRNIVDYQENLIHIRNGSSPLDPMKYVKYAGIGTPKFQKQFYTQDELTLNNSFPQIWGKHSRDIDADYDSYKADPLRPRDFSNKEEYEKDLTRKIRIQRLSRDRTLDEKIVEPEILALGGIAEELKYKTVYNPELQLHRGISPLMYKSLGGPLLGFKSPEEFWATLSYVTQKTQKYGNDFFWTLYYLRDNGNTMDDIIRAIIRYDKDLDGLEKYLQSGHYCKIDTPSEKPCPLHSNLLKHHSKMYCVLDIPFSVRMELFKKLNICPHYGQNFNKAQLCVAPHNPNRCNQADKLVSCKHCLDTNHMKAWCPWDAYDSGHYDCVIFAPNGDRRTAIPPKTH